MSSLFLSNSSTPVMTNNLGSLEYPKYQWCLPFATVTAAMVTDTFTHHITY
uniref:Uncharacterized protein n=1 Tax=Anguilla anguilla TaxID=7936 RepID=A0A0E9UDE3_ANGAN